MARRKPIRKITPRMLDAARMAAFGERAQDIAARLGVDESSVRRWLADARVQEEFRTILRNAQVFRVARAQRVLDEQLESGEGKGFLAQNAANSILNRYEAAVMGEEKQDVTIHFTAGAMPVIGMPEQADEA